MFSAKLLISKRGLATAILVIDFFAAQSQTLRRPLSASYTGLGAYSFNHTDIFSSAANQASLATLKKFSAGVYGERRFLLNELGFYQLTIGLPTASGNFGVNAMYFGFADYNEMNAGLAYGRKLGERINAGVQFNYYSIRTSGYGSASTVNAELGVVFKLTEKLYTGLHIANPAGGKFGKNKDEKLASVYSAGFGYEASGKFFTGAEIIKEENQPVNVNAGIQYRLLPQLLARGGISTAASVFYFGLGVPVKNFRIDVTATFHQQLGVTPGLLLIYQPYAADK
jgi:hypothetical protein